jgi:hypothetical protein
MRRVARGEREPWGTCAIEHLHTLRLHVLTLLTRKALQDTALHTSDRTWEMARDSDSVGLQALAGELSSLFADINLRNRFENLAARAGERPTNDVEPMVPATQAEPSKYFREYFQRLCRDIGQKHNKSEPHHDGEPGTHDLVKLVDEWLTTQETAPARAATAPSAALRFLTSLIVGRHDLVCL